MNVQTPDGSVIQFPDDMPEDQVNAAANDYWNSTNMGKNQNMTANAVTAMQNNGSSATAGLPAQMLGYAANVEKAIPFMHEVGSAEAAIPSLLNGIGAYSDKYNELEQSQQALRQAADQTQPRIETPAWMPDITPSGVGQVGAALALSPLMPGGGETPKSTLGAMWQGTKTGVGYGAAYGAGNGNAFDTALGSMEDRGINAGIGAATGAVLGGAAGGAAYKIGQSLTKAPQLSTSDKIISETLAKDNISPDQMIDTIQNSKQPLTIADVAGPSVQNLTEGIANTPGTALSDSTNFLQNRNLQANSQINDIISRHISPIDYVEQRQATVNNLSNPEIKQDYTAAYNAAPSINDPQINQTLDKLLSTDIGRKAWQGANQAATLDGTTLGPVDATGLQRGMSTYGIDQFKRQLDSTIQGEAQAGNFDRMSPLGAQITNLKNQLVSRTDEINPFFAQARAKYGDQASMINAADMGYQDLWSNAPGAASKVQQQFQQMTPIEQQSLLSGAARKVQEMGRTQAGDNVLPNTANPAKNIINNPNVREKLSYVLPQDKLDNFTNEMGLQGSMQDTANKILGNSATARRLATQQDFADQTQSAIQRSKPLMKYAANFDIVQPASWFGLNPRNVEQLGQNMSGANRQQVGSEIAQKLLSPNKQQNISMLNRMSADQMQKQFAAQSMQRYLQAGNGSAMAGIPRLLAPFSFSPQTQGQ